MLKKALVAGLFLFVFKLPSFAQVDLVGKLNVGIGMDYRTLDFLGSEVIYSSGGGMGIEVGLIFPFNKLEAYTMLGYQQNLAMQYESSTYGGTHETSFTFNRKSVIGGANYKLFFSERRFRGFKIGGGFNFNFPGTYSITENNDRFGDIKYQQTLGYHVNVDLVIELNEISLVPGLRYRHIEYPVKSYEEGAAADLPKDLRNLNASGIDISISIIKHL